MIYVDCVWSAVITMNRTTFSALDFDLLIEFLTYHILIEMC